VVDGAKKAADAGAAAAQANLGSNSPPKWFEPAVSGFKWFESEEAQDLFDKMNIPFDGIEMSTDAASDNFEDALAQVVESSRTEADRAVAEINKVLISAAAGVETPEVNTAFTTGEFKAQVSTSVSDSIADATQELVEKFNKVPTEVQFDFKQIEDGIAKVLSTAIDRGLKAGFSESKTHVSVKVGAQEILEAIADTTTRQGEKIQLIG
jgi:histidinol-phosphate/aromatic aminotransferase/cobyric acid decarboxylase-like protein